MKKVVYMGLAASAIALSANSLSAKESYGQNSPDTTFVCSTENTASTMYAYTPGKAVLTPLISWYEEYLLPETSSAEVCQQVATKLQELSQERTTRYIATQKQEDQTLVCMVTRENDDCSSDDSENLFGVNPNYSPVCVLNRFEPIECTAIVMQKRGAIMPESANSPYRPIWWPW
ncbi:conserved exported hypothetical protein [Hyella patelloides LEGE 07179]|uniref:Uncharacterized protein n=1 Tax=Hyella patelloides LEGE 07179 TaxID=945734 RepID=A0A563VXH0_9CYAN|nr:COP23 domain-containing protein [Hyella patelloides]VEP16121.1 conserved exported hypothetical protein [Hyella patelloides LEGE 07179]